MPSLVVLTFFGQTTHIGQSAAPHLLCHRETHKHMGGITHMEGEIYENARGLRIMLWIIDIKTRKLDLVPEENNLLGY
jgi:hypothetical protein